MERFYYACRIWRDDATVYHSYDYLTYHQLRDLLNRKGDGVAFVCIHSIYQDYLHLPFFDFDCESDDLKIIEEEKEKHFNHIVTYMQKHQLDGFLYETHHGYHLILNALYELTRYMDVLDTIKGCEGFRAFTVKRKVATLRVTPKPNRENDCIIFKGRINFTTNQAIHPALYHFFETRYTLEKEYYLAKER